MACPLPSPLMGPVHVTRVALLIRHNQIKLWPLLKGLAGRKAFLECVLVLHTEDPVHPLWGDDEFNSWSLGDPVEVEDQWCCSGAEIREDELL